MTLSNCYFLFGGNYDEVFKRLPSSELIHKYLLKFEREKEFDVLQNALAHNDYSKAELSAYSIMNISLDLGFTPLQKSSHELYSAIKKRDASAISTLVRKIQADYNCVCTAIRQYKAALQND